MNPVFFSATQQLSLLRQHRLSPLELAELHIAQIDRLNPTLNALVDYDPDRIRQAVAALPPGPLHGLPVTIKSSIATADHHCAIGSRLQAGNTPSKDADAVAILRQHGALILGTTNCPEFLMAYETDNLLHGRTRNPWDLERTPGGSSGGESAAIAAGMSAAGLGSDSGGSVREPAHFTGICALKPTSGRISAEGHLPPCIGPFSRLGALGPMARSIADLRLLFDLLATGSLERSSSVRGVPVREISLAEARQHPIGYFADDELGPVTPETRKAVEAAAQALREAGFSVQPFRPALLAELRRLWTVFFVQCGAMFYAPTIAGREAGLSPIFREFLSIADQHTPLTADALLQAWAGMDEVTARFLEQLREYPLLLLPVCAVPAFRHGERAWSVEGRSVSYLDAMRFTQWFNLLGAPAAVVPVGQSTDGLPIGVQLAGRPFADELVLTVAQVLDEAFGYRKPPLA